MNEKVTSTTLASTQKINDIIKKTYNKSSYLVEEKFHSNEEYEYDNEEMTQDLRKLIEEIKKATIDIKNNATRVTNIFEDVIGNDVNKDEEIPLLLRLKLRRQNVIIEEKQISSMCNNY